MLLGSKLCQQNPPRLSAVRGIARATVTTILVYTEFPEAISLRLASILTVGHTQLAAVEDCHSLLAIKASPVS